MIENPPDDTLDHDVEKTDQIAKSVDPDRDFMKAENLCVRCHGPRVLCERNDCPQKSAE